MEIPDLVTDCERGIACFLQGLWEIGYVCRWGLWSSR